MTTNNAEALRALDVLERAAETLHDLGAPHNAEEVRKVAATLAAQPQANGQARVVARVQRGSAPHDPLYAMLLPGITEADAPAGTPLCVYAPASQPQADRAGWGAVEWQVRYHDDDEGWSPWHHIDERHVPVVRDRAGTEVRQLYAATPAPAVEREACPHEEMSAEPGGNPRWVCGNCRRGFDDWGDAMAERITPPAEDHEACRRCANALTGMCDRCAAKVDAEAREPVGRLPLMEVKRWAERNGISADALNELMSLSATEARERKPRGA